MRSPRLRRYGRPVCLCVASVAIALLLVSCGGGPQAEEVEFRVPVTAGEVTTGSVENLVVATGTLRAAESVLLVAESPGRLQVSRPSGRRLAEGDHVSAGQTVASITGEDARLAARTEATYQRYQVTEREHQSRQRLFEAGLISEEELRTAEATLAEAKIDWERSRLTEDRAQLVTPISGVIVELARDDNDQPVADGQLVAPGFEVARISPMGTLIADIDLVGPDLALVRTGQTARVRHYAWDQVSFDGTVIRLAPSIDPQTRTFRAEVSVGNPTRLLRPGMFVEVTLVAEQREDVPVVPRDAVTERGGASVVFRLEGQRVSQTEVTLGLGDDDIVEVRQGVQPGDRIVVRGLETLTDGTRVRVTGG